MTILTTSGIHRICSGLRNLRRGGLAAGFALALAGCVTVPAEEPERDERPQERQERAGAAVEPATPDPLVTIKEDMISAGLAEAIDAYRAGRSLRPYAAVYSIVGGLRPVQLNDKDRQASDSDADLLLESIHALSDNPDLKAFAVFGLAEDAQGRRWFAVHYETRQGEAQLRQYPLPPPAEVGIWEPAAVEPSDAVVF